MGAKFSCFFSMRHQSDLTASLLTEARERCARYGIEIIVGVGEVDPWNTVSRKIQNAIDRSVAVLVETSDFSWWVAFELFYSLDRKICIPLVPDPPSSSGLAAASFVRMFPYLDAIPYNIYASPHLDDRFDNALRRLMVGTALWAENLSRASGKAFGPTRHGPIVLPSLEINGTETISPQELYSAWLSPGNAILRTAVIGPPGCGKTFLLSHFANSIDRQRDPKTATELDPLIVRVRARDIANPVQLEVEIEEQSKKWHSSTAGGELVSVAVGGQPGLFQPYRQAGLVYVLVDGLDEFIVRNREKAEDLLKSLAGLRERGIHLIISCRENLWLQQLQAVGFSSGSASGREAYSTVRVLRFDEERARRLLRDVAIPSSALNDHQRLKEWLLNPLLLGFVLDLSRRSPSVGFETRTQLYDQWARETLSTGITSEVDTSALLHFYGALATKLVKQREPALVPWQVKLLMREYFPGSKLTIDHVLNGEVLRENRATGDVEFAHESIYEFFIARALVDDFITAVDPETPSARLSELALSEVELDYPQSAVYGFILEFLHERQGQGKDFEELVRRCLPALANATQAWRLIRNLVEYLGMTHHSESTDSETALALLNVACNAKLLPRVRYNALRALERVHPCAPRPYFRHVSDWGDLDYRQISHFAERNQSSLPIVMRGHGKKEPQPGSHWAWLANSDVNWETELQQKVSDVLTEMLRECIQADLDEGLSINASHALIRWFHPNDLPALDQLRRDAHDGAKTALAHNLGFLTSR